MDFHILPAVVWIPSQIPPTVLDMPSPTLPNIPPIPPQKLFQPSLIPLQIPLAVSFIPLPISFNVLPIPPQNSFQPSPKSPNSVPTPLVNFSHREMYLSAPSLANKILWP